MALTRLRNNALDPNTDITADQLDIGQIGGRRNLIINGAMQVWQRGANVSSVSFNSNGADRWTSHATANADREAFTVGQTDVPGEPKYYSRHTCVSTAMGFGQKIEDVRIAAGQYVTFSFWAKANKDIDGDVLFRQRFGSGGSSTVFDDMNGEVKLDTNWRYFSFTHKYQSIDGKTIGVDSFTEVGVYIPTASSGDYIDFTNVQLELGSVATPFEHRSYGEELALCQRYFQKWGGTGSTYRIGIAHYETSNAVRGNLEFIVPMRTVPSMSTSGSLRFYTNTGRQYTPALNVDNVYRAAWAGTTTTTGVVGYCGFIDTAGYPNSYITADAEL